MTAVDVIQRLSRTPFQVQDEKQTQLEIEQDAMESRKCIYDQKEVY